MTTNHSDYLAAVEVVKTRPLTRREKNHVEREARRRGVSLQEAEACLRSYLAYWEGSASASFVRAVARGDVKTVVAS